MFWFLEFSHTLQTGADRQDSRGSKTNRPRMGGGGEGRFPRPDVTKMVPYLPEMATTAPSPPALAGPATEDNATPAASTVLFGLPPPLLTVVQMLPPASSYQGIYLEHLFSFPFSSAPRLGIRPNIDMVLDLIRDMPLPPLDKEMRKVRSCLVWYHVTHPRFTSWLRNKESERLLNWKTHRIGLLHTIYSARDKLRNSKDNNSKKIKALEFFFFFFLFLMIFFR